jgi:negative regulator of sigma E activity
MEGAREVLLDRMGQVIEQFNTFAVTTGLPMESVPSPGNGL